MKPVEFSLHLNQQATSYPSPHCLVNQIQVQKPIQVVCTNQMSNHTSQITSSGSSLMYSRKGIGPRMEP